MAEEYVRLVKIGIDKGFIDQSIANADKLTAAIDNLKKVKKEEGQLSAEQEGQLKALTAERNKNIQVIKQANLLTSEQIKGQERLKAQLSILTAQYNKLTTEEQQNTKEGQALQKTIRSISDELKANEKAIGDNRRNVGNYEAALEGVNERLDKFGNAAKALPGPIGSMASGIVTMTKAAIGFIATPLGAVLAAVALAIGAVRAAFTSSEEGQNKWNKIMGVSSALIGNFTDLLADFGEKIIAVFENPQQALKNFSELLRKNIINRFEGLIELVPALGRSIQQLFKGNFSEAAKIATDATGKIALGVENITDKTNSAIAATGKFIEEQKKEAAEAAKVADMRAKADIIERELLVERAKKEAEIAELRLKARKEDEFTSGQRKKFLEEAKKIQDELLDAETEYLTLRKDAQVLENTFSRTNKENKDKEAEAIAALSQLEAKRFTEQRQLQREFNTINKQIEASAKAAAAEKKKQTEEEIKAQKEREQALLKGYQEERALIDEQADYQRAKAELSIKSEEERAKAIAYIDKQALLDKIASIDDETAAYTASADAIGSVDEEKYANQLKERAKYEAQLAAMDRAAKAQAFNDQIELLNGQEQLDIQAAELSIQNEQELQNKKYQIALDFAQKRLALMREQALMDDILTEKEKQNLQSVENTIKQLQQTLANPEAPTAAQSLGLSDEQIEKMQLGLDVISGLLASVQQATAAAAQNRIQEIDQQTQAEITGIEKSTLSEEKKKAKITALEQKAAREKYKIELAQFKTAKALQIALAVANTATAVMAQLSNPTPYAGFVLAALAAATGAVQIGIVASQKPPAPPQFATGGLVKGPGTGTSDSIHARLSNGEAVMNARSTKMFAPILSAMNAAGGGVDWYKGYSKGGVAGKFASGGIVTSSQAIMRENEQQAEIVKTIIQTPPVLVLEEFQSVQGRQVRTEQNLQL